MVLNMKMMTEAELKYLYEDLSKDVHAQCPPFQLGLKIIQSILRINPDPIWEEIIKQGKKKGKC